MAKKDTLLAIQKEMAKFKYLDYVKFTYKKCLHEGYVQGFNKVTIEVGVENNTYPYIHVFLVSPFDLSLTPDV